MSGVREAAGEERDKLCIGVMSGTSVDGIDVAIVRIGGQPPGLTAALLYFLTVQYDEEVKQAIFRLFDPAVCTSRDVSQMNFLLGDLFADAVLQTVQEAGVDLRDVLLISSHGQTVFHSPEAQRVCGREVRSTLQIGEAAVIAERTGCPVVSDFRVRDIAAGGQGAPLVPFVDALLFASPDHDRILANIGGIANITHIPPSGSHEPILAFDTGPGNMIVDALVRMGTDGRLAYDKDGALAAQGAVQEAYLRRWLEHPYLARRPPKSTGREEFGEPCAKIWWRDAQAMGWPLADLAATATEYTVRTMAQAILRWTPAKSETREVFVAGGGAHNPVIMAGLARALPGQAVLQQSAAGIAGDAKEAVAFAVLGHECFQRRPNNLPRATGARHPAVLGKICWP